MRLGGAFRSCWTVLPPAACHTPPRFVLAASTYPHPPRFVLVAAMEHQDGREGAESCNTAGVQKAKKNVGKMGAAKLCNFAKGKRAGGLYICLYKNFKSEWESSNSTGKLET